MLVHRLCAHFSTEYPPVAGSVSSRTAVSPAARSAGVSQSWMLQNRLAQRESQRVHVPHPLHRLDGPFCCDRRAQQQPVETVGADHVVHGVGSVQGPHRPGRPAAALTADRTVPARTQPQLSCPALSGCIRDGAHGPYCPRARSGYADDSPLARTWCVRSPQSAPIPLGRSSQPVRPPVVPQRGRGRSEAASSDTPDTQGGSQHPAAIVPPGYSTLGRAAGPSCKLV